MMNDSTLIHVFVQKSRLHIWMSFIAVLHLLHFFIALLYERIFCYWVQKDYLEGRNEGCFI